jgi:histidinol-phosphate aminotransferase
MPETAIPISRRGFTRLLSAGAAFAALRPEISAASRKVGWPGLMTGRNSWRDLTGKKSAAGAVVRLNSNENPYGPSPLALKAMTEAFGLAWRYPDEHADILIDTLAKLNGVSRDQILLGDGSGEILQASAAAFTGSGSAVANPVALATPSHGGAFAAFKPGRGKLVVPDPTYEAIANHARVNGAEVVRVPLTSSYSHDLPKMLAAASEGLIYICNPNNPTASITPKNELRDFLAKAPRETTILVDEAYFHYADSDDYESVMPMVKDHPNLIVARTFSKIYGMAGLRCGYCVAQPETIQRLRPHQTWDSVNIMALAAAIASLNDSDQVTKGRRLNSETKKWISGEIEALGYKYIPSQANFMMVDLRRPVRPAIDAMRQRGVQVGRMFPALPNHMRVTIGKREEMEAFLAAFRQVMS